MKLTLKHSEVKGLHSNFHSTAIATNKNTLREHSILIELMTTSDPLSGRIKCDS
jgi:hypothetical protein